MLATYVYGILSDRNYAGEMPRAVDHLLIRYKGRGLDAPKKLIGVGLTVTN